MSDRKVVLELADWLANIRQGDEESIAQNDPVIQLHIAKLAAWEKVLRSMIHRIDEDTSIAIVVGLSE
jgi:hypothetical protein